MATVPAQLTDKPKTLSDTSVINYYGRNYVTDSKVTFLNTSSGFEVRFVGSTLTATFTRRGPGAYHGAALGAPALLRLRVYPDGDKSIQSSRVITLDESTDGKEIVLAQFSDGGIHTVLVRKMNYDWWGYVELTGLGCDGTFCPAPDKPEKKILVYGDSITVGYGVEYPAVGGVGGDVPEKEDGTRAYAALFADHFGAQIAEYCNSGVSIGIPCWREKAIMDDGYFRQYAYFDTGSRYDMGAYVPDLIICNLGTNDHGGLVNGVSNFGNGTACAPADRYTPKDLEVAYSAFITSMKDLYPHAVIIIGYGMMGTSATVDTAIRHAVRDCGYADVRYCNFTTVECSANAGHPTLAGQTDGYRQLVRFLEEERITF